MGASVCVFVQITASILFTGMYIWSTYDAPAVFSFRWVLDSLLCMGFIADYLITVMVRASSSSTPLHPALSFIEDPSVAS